jgi:hypothetical protein
MMIQRILLPVGVLWIILSCEMCATVLNCNGSQSDCQSKVNSAIDGDVVNIPSGTFTWSSSVSWSNKDITVKGQGVGVTILNASSGAFVVTDLTKASFRLTGLTVNAGSNNAIVIENQDSTTSSYGWRVDHFAINGNGGIGILVQGPNNWGLVDHGSFNGNMNGVQLYAYSNCDTSPCGGNTPTANGWGGISWGTPLHIGSHEAVYVEDSTFTGGPCAGQSLGVNDMEYGARMVFRHNRVTCEYIQSHSARAFNRGGAMWMEIYNNTWIGNGFVWPGTIRAGTGVIFNNTISGYSSNNIEMDDQRITEAVNSAEYYVCDGTHSWDGNIIPASSGTADGAGWPCMDQIGRGQGALGSEPSLPYLLWNNGTTSTCATGGTCNNATTISLNNSGSVNPAPYITTTAHTNGDKDYCIGATMPTTCGNYTNTYRPYTYPHPLQASGGGAAPNPPEGLKATVQ